MTDKPEHCYMCEHRADIGQGDFYCGLDEKNHCLLGADFPSDCPLQKGGQMKPVKGKIWHGWVDTYTTVLPDTDDDDKSALDNIPENTPVLICSDPGLTESEINALKIILKIIRQMSGAHADEVAYSLAFASGLEKLLKMAGILE